MALIISAAVENPGGRPFFYIYITDKCRHCYCYAMATTMRPIIDLFVGIFMGIWGILFGTFMAIFGILLGTFLASCGILFAMFMTVWAVLFAAFMTVFALSVAAVAAGVPLFIVFSPVLLPVIYFCTSYRFGNITN